jgi:hypothetical protein
MGAGVDGRLSELFEWLKGFYRRLLAGVGSRGLQARSELKGEAYSSCVGVSGSYLAPSSSPEDSPSLSKRSRGHAGWSSGCSPCSRKYCSSPVTSSCLGAVAMGLTPILSGNVGASGEFENWVLRGAGSAGGRSGDHL